jgi:hypothetical protein
MPGTDVVRDYQVALSRHVSEHRRAITRLREAIARRERALVAQDEKVAAAQKVVDQSIAGMAHALGCRPPRVRDHLG